MPRNQFQRMIFALLTVIVTVHSYVFFSLYVVNGDYFLSIEGATGVIDGINRNGGVMMFGRMFPIWAVVLLEFCLAYTLECVMGSPCSFAEKPNDQRIKSGKYIKEKEKVLELALVTICFGQLLIKWFQK